MPRKSAAALAVVVTPIDSRPEPPEDLTKFQKEIWRRTVASEPSALFKSATAQQLLKEYCRHVATADMLSKMVDEFHPELIRCIEGEDRRCDRLLTARDRETKAVVNFARQLRLTNQSRWQPQSAHNMTKNREPTAKPWETAS
jgi:hypothetical protein